MSSGAYSPYGTWLLHYRHSPNDFATDQAAAPDCVNGACSFPQVRSQLCQCASTAVRQGFRYPCPCSALHAYLYSHLQLPVLAP